jgi:hypothetical protein
MSAPKRLARIAGLLYLVVGTFGAFAVGYVGPKVYAAGDAATTAANVLANTGLVRIGVVADLFQATVLVFLGLTLYRLLKHVNQHAASAMMVLVAIATTTMCLDKVFQVAAVRVATDTSYAASFGAAGANALVLLLLDMHNHGYIIAQIFFGLWLVPLGYLAYTSGCSPGRWASCSSRAASPTWWTCSRRSWSPNCASKSATSWPSCRPSRRSGWSATCS